MATMALGRQSTIRRRPDRGRAANRASGIGQVGRRLDASDNLRLPDSTRQAAASITPKAINLALQGGGAHGAIAWGVLDRLLEDERITFDGISATSAGAMNAAALAHGWTIGGRDGAKSALASFWDRVADVAGFGWLQPNWLDGTGHEWWRAWPGSGLLDLMSQSSSIDMLTRLLSPYEFNPLNVNPLRDILTAIVDFEALRSPQCPIKLFVSATNVRTGKIKIFEGRELTADMVMASACLPQLFQAVEVDGEHYWDGGFMGNPAIFPLIKNCANRDIVVVRVSPFFRQEAPRTAREIRDRIIEISFNATLVRELGVISFISQLIDDGQIARNALSQVRIHSISADKAVTKLSRDSALIPDRQYLRRLCDLGRRHTDAWLVANFDLLGRKSTIEFGKEFRRLAIGRADDRSAGEPAWSPSTL